MRRGQNSAEMVGFVLQSSVIYAWKWKKEGQKKKNHTQGPCLISMATWRLLSYLAIHYQRNCVDGEWDIVRRRKDGVSHFLLTAEPKRDGMNECEQNYTNHFSDKRIFCRDSVMSVDGELNQWPLKNLQNQALDQFPFNNINFRDYPVSKHASHQIAEWLGSRPPQFRGVGKFPLD